MKDMMEIILSEVEKNNIKIYKWSKSQCGLAEEGRQIKIPKPVDYETLGICFHEIGHIDLGHMDEGDNKLRYIEEYEAEIYAIKKLKEYGFYNKQYEYRAIHYVLQKLAQARNRGHNMKNVPKEIVRWTGMQVCKWNKASRVFVTRHSGAKTKSDVKIKLYE